MKVIEAGVRPSTPADPARYSGEVWTDALIEGGPPGNINVGRVAFSPGTRTAWHTHPFGQILVVVSGGAGLQGRRSCRAPSSRRQRGNRAG